MLIEAETIHHFLTDTTEKEKIEDNSLFPELIRHYAKPMRCALVCLIASSLLGGSLPAQVAQEHLVISESKTFQLTYDYTTSWPREGEHEARFYLPVPPETPTQHILSFHSTLKGTYLQDNAHPPHKLLTAPLHHTDETSRLLHWQVNITGVFKLRHLVEGAPEIGPEGSPAPPASGDYLDSTETINWDTERFHDWLETSGLQKRDQESAWHLGRRIYDYLRQNGSYQYPPETAWNASATCRSLETDCGGFSIVFVAACRANHLPARLRVGQWLKMRDMDDDTLEMTGHQSHVYAEFFDRELGWIPVDLSSTLLHVPGRYGSSYFGQDPGFFLVWHHDSDFHLVTPEKADEHVQWMQNPAIWFAADACSSAQNSDHHWTLESVTETPAAP